MKQIIDHIVASFDIRKITALLEQSQRVVMVLLIGIIFVDSLFVKTSSDFVTFGILLLYGVFAKAYQWKSRETFLLCLGLLSAMFISFVFSYASISTEKLTVWLYLFLIVGIIQRWKE